MSRPTLQFALGGLIVCAIGGFWLGLQGALPREGASSGSAEAASTTLEPAPNATLTATEAAPYSDTPIASDEPPASEAPAASEEEPKPAPKQAPPPTTPRPEPTPRTEAPAASAAPATPAPTPAPASATPPPEEDLPPY